MLSFTFVLLFILTFLPSCASNSISELEVVLTSVASGQQEDMRLASRQHVTVHCIGVSQSHSN